MPVRQPHEQYARMSHDCRTNVKKIGAAPRVLNMFKTIVAFPDLGRSHTVRPESCTEPIQKLQYTTTPRATSVTISYYYQLLCLVHKYRYRNNKLPVIFLNYFSSSKDIHHHHTRSSSLLHLSSVCTSVRTKSKFKASQLWNTLPERFRKV